jgi:hypothetical protein
MVAQALLGVRLPDRYRDIEWIAATWWGNDWVTLLVAVPLLAGAHACAQTGSARALLLYLGTLAYAIYNYAYYLLGAALNIFFPLYASALLLAALSLITSLSTVNAAHLSSRFGRETPIRAIGGYFVVVGVSLAVVWIAIWAAYAFAGRPTPIEPEAFKVVAALDLVLMAPPLIIGGTLLWRHQPWGYIVGAIGGVQASLYLIVLSVNSLVFLARGLTAWPGELPMWGTLAMLSSVMTLVLFLNIDRRMEASHGDSSHIGVVVHITGCDGERHIASLGIAAIARRGSRTRGQLSDVVCGSALHRDDIDQLDGTRDAGGCVVHWHLVAGPHARV